MQKVENPLGYKSIWRLLASFSGPTIIATLVYSIYNIVDQVYIGQGVGYLGNAATTVSFPITTLMSAISLLISAGGSAYASIRLGEKREDEAERTLSNMLLASLVLGLIYMAVCLLFIKPLLRIFGTTDEIMPYAMDYAPIILIGTPAMMLASVLANMARTDGAPKISMFGTVLGAALNAVLDPVYMFVFHWGVRGAAIATITSQYISAAVLLIYFIRKSKNPLHMRLKRKYLKLDFGLTGSYLKLGISSCVTQGVGAIMQTIMNNTLRYYGALSPVGTGNGGKLTDRCRDPIARRRNVRTSLCRRNGRANLYRGRSKNIYLQALRRYLYGFHTGRRASSSRRPRCCGRVRYGWENRKKPLFRMQYGNCGAGKDTGVRPSLPDRSCAGNSTAGWEHHEDLHFLQDGREPERDPAGKIHKAVPNFILTMGK